MENCVEGRRGITGHCRAYDPHCVGAQIIVSDVSDYTIPVHAERRGLHHVLIEIRQDLIAGENGQRNWAARLARPLLQAHLAL